MTLFGLSLALSLAWQVHSNILCLSSLHVLADILALLALNSVSRKKRYIFIPIHKSQA
jgi:hypothetical protein